MQRGGVKEGGAARHRARRSQRARCPQHAFQVPSLALQCLQLGLGLLQLPLLAEVGCACKGDGWVWVEGCVCKGCGGCKGWGRVHAGGWGGGLTSLDDAQAGEGTHNIQRAAHKDGHTRNCRRVVGGWVSWVGGAVGGRGVWGGGVLCARAGGGGEGAGRGAAAHEALAHRCGTAAATCESQCLPEGRLRGKSKTPGTSGCVRGRVVGVEGVCAGV